MNSQRVKLLVQKRPVIELVGAAILSAALNTLLTSPGFLKRMYEIDALSWISMSFDSAGGLAGVWFGLFTGIVLMPYFELSRKRLRLMLWIATSGLGYMFAFAVVMFLVMNRWAESDYTYGGDVLPVLPLDFAIGGLVGALMLSAGYHFIFQRLSFVQHSVIACIGALSAFFVASIFLKTLPAGDQWQLNFFPSLHFVWQFAVAAAIALASFSSYPENKSLERLVF